MKKIILFLILTFYSLNLFASTLDEKKNQINKIENEIKRKDEEIKKNTEKIKTLNKQTETLKDQITRVGLELKILEDEKKVLNDKINIVNRKIDYGKRNLKFSSNELTIKENEYLVILQALQRNQITDEKEMRDFKKVLQANKDRQEEIKGVRHNIQNVKNDIEKEQRNLRTLKSQLASKEKEQELKIKQHNQLIQKYNSDKATTTANTAKAKNSISSLQKQRNAIEKEINNIIKARTKQLGNVNYATVAKNLGSFRKPISGKVVIGFNGKKAGGVRSSGQEISGKLGDRVHAGNKGKVIFAGEFMNMGRVVMIDHGYNLITIYGNLIRSYVKIGDTVKKGQEIGILGLNLDGKSYLYYETRFNLKASNPNNF
ncbi:MAG: peptidoglycan DD-metalloendopeptidase family protein [Psychrilyobacter sp.]|nr:peptidoglycan DD-metalloendopeptidase family protein [Psychrilyobacter sp.]